MIKKKLLIAQWLLFFVLLYHNKGFYFRQNLNKSIGWDASIWDTAQNPSLLLIGTLTLSSVLTLLFYKKKQESIIPYLLVIIWTVFVIFIRKFT